MVTTVQEFRISFVSLGAKGDHAVSHVYTSLFSFPRDGINGGGDYGVYGITVSFVDNGQTGLSHCGIAWSRDSFTLLMLPSLLFGTLLLHSLVLQSRIFE